VAIVTSHNRDSVPLSYIESVQIIVGTSCAGTGLDISGVGHIIVVGLPFSIEQLLQWAGRCRLNGTVAVFVPSFHMKKDDELAGEIGDKSP
jgi:superfamily II DNA/RNA helicase